MTRAGRGCLGGRPHARLLVTMRPLSSSSPPQTPHGSSRCDGVGEAVVAQRALVADRLGPADVDEVVGEEQRRQRAVAVGAARSGGADDRSDVCPGRVLGVRQSCSSRGPCGSLRFSCRVSWWCRRRGEAGFSVGSARSVSGGGGLVGHVDCSFRWSVVEKPKRPSGEPDGLRASIERFYVDVLPRCRAGRPVISRPMWPIWRSYPVVHGF